MSPDAEEMLEQALVLLRDAGDEDGAARLAALSPADLESLLSEGGGEPDSADPFPPPH